MYFVINLHKLLNMYSKKNLLFILLLEIMRKHQNNSSHMILKSLLFLSSIYIFSKILIYV